MPISATTFSPFSAFAAGATTNATANATANPAAGGNVSSTTQNGVDTITKAGATSGYSLSTDDFMKLFLAQMQNQDPTKPLDNTQMLSQLSQMTQVQTLQDVQKTLAGSQLAQSSALIGKHVTGLDVNGDPVDGQVSSVTQSNDAGLVLKVGEQYIKPDAVVNVTAS
jgi:flagellar basal-body rod modification protein FlgD